MTVLDLFSAAAGGWSLGMHRAGFVTVAACEAVDWRRTLYAENNPGVPIYEDVRGLSASRLVRDLGYLPDVVVGSPPCQDISSANTNGKGVEGERSGLFFEAVRIIGEVRPRWFALENSANLRTRGADAVLAELERIGYACWALVVRAADVGANHERPRCWIVGCDLEQVADADRQFPDVRTKQSRAQSEGRHISCHGTTDRNSCGPDGAGAVQRRHGRMGQAACSQHAAILGHESGRPWRHGPDGDREAYAGDPSQDGCGQGLPRRPAGATGRSEQPTRRDAADAIEARYAGRGALRSRWPARNIHARDHDVEGAGCMGTGRNTPDPDQARQAHGCLEPGLRQAEIADDGCGYGRSDDGSRFGQVAICPSDRGDPDGGRTDWSLADLAGRLWLDDGLPARVAGTRVAVGGPKGTAAASLIVEAYGDAVLPQIPEAIGRAILRVEAAMAAIYQTRAAA